VAERDRERWRAAREATIDGSRQSALRSAEFGAAKAIALGVMVAGTVAALIAPS
jgi:hypothetical protein